MTPLRMAAELRPALPQTRAADRLSGLPPEKSGDSWTFGLKPSDTGREDNMSAVCAAWLWGRYVSGGWWVGV